MGYKIVADSSANLYEIEGVNYTTVPLKITTAIGDFVDKEGIELKKMVDYLLLPKTNHLLPAQVSGIGFRPFRVKKRFMRLLLPALFLAASTPLSRLEMPI